MLFFIGTVKYCLAMPHYLDERLTGVTKVLPELLCVYATAKTQTYINPVFHVTNGKKKKNMLNYL